MYVPDNKVHGAKMGPIWGRQDPGGPHFGRMNFAIWDIYDFMLMLIRITIFSSYLHIYGIIEKRLCVHFKIDRF